MKAVQFERFGPPEVLAMAERPLPVPGPGEVLVEIAAASVTPGDAKLRAGLLQTIFPVSLPCIPGRDGAGRVVALGAGVDYAKVGDRVCFVAERTVQGSYATHIVRDADSVVVMPETLSFREGAALMHAGTCAWMALVDTGKAQAGQRLLVHGGSGAIGGMAIQIGRHLGAWVAVTCHSKNRDYVLGLGAHEAFAYDRDEGWDRLSEIDLVLDLVGGNLHERSYPVVRPGGTIVWLIASPFRDLSKQYGVRTVQAHIVDKPEVNAAVIALAGQGALRAQVSLVLPLAQAAEAHRLIEAGQNSRGRIILEP
jgi:NADPH:quinone reductase-like Zn-dependent oxidoreductase